MLCNFFVLLIMMKIVDWAIVLFDLVDSTLFIFANIFFEYWNINAKGKHATNVIQLITYSVWTVKNWHIDPASHLLEGDILKGTANFTCRELSDKLGDCTLDVSLSGLPCFGITAGVLKIFLFLLGFKLH